jgi:hypothetical protein
MSRSKLEAPSAWGTCWTIPRRRRCAKPAGTIWFSRGLPCGGERHAIFFIRAFPGCAVPDRALLPEGNGRSSVTFKLNQLSLACPVKRAQPPWTVVETALMP